MRHLASVTLGVTAALFATTALVVAQETPLAPPAQTTEDPMVAAAAATHIAVLGAMEGAAAPADAAGAAWFLLDDQNNALMWTVELTGFTATAVGIACGAGEMGPPAAEMAFELGAGGADAPIEGEAATLEQALFDGIAAGQCWVVAVGEGEGNEIRGLIEVVAGPME